MKNLRKASLHFSFLCALMTSWSVFNTTLVFGDTTSAYPPHPYELDPYQVSPGFSNANAQAIYWINLIDQHQYWATWLEAGGLLKDLISQQQWADAMSGIRTPLGTVRSRKVAGHQIREILPHGTKGNFIIITYRTEFSRKANSTETIILMTEGNLSLWKVISYNIA